MRVVTNGILMISGACIALGIIHFRFWLMERSRRDELAFSILCFSIAAYSGFELSMMHSASPEDYGFWLKWSHLANAPLLVSVAWFAYVSLGGRRWMFLTFLVMRILVLLLNFVFTLNINVRRVNAMVPVNVLGEELFYPVVTPNPWTLLAQGSFILLIIFCLHASYLAWKRGERRKAWVFGVGVALFTVFNLLFVITITWGIVKLPLFVSYTFFFVAAAMVYELNYEMQTSALLSKKLIEHDATLTETLKQLNLSASAGNVGMWTRKIGEDKIWVSEKGGEIWGFHGERQFTREEFFKSLHPEDKQFVLSTIKELEEGKNEFLLEYRIFTKDGELRWVEARGKVEPVNGSRVIRGAIVDITKRKLAEDAVHELSRQLMDAQEKERARLARELHDDLSQSLALLSSQMSGLCDESDDVGYIKEQIQHLVSKIVEVSRDVRRISHELHPAKLSQLGLESALRGLCREIAAAYNLKLDFKAENLPLKLPDDVSLSLYRIAQESLQNVVNHSDATNARVSIKLENGEVRLSVSDNGNGFDPDAEKAKESLGLISIDERARAVKGTVKITSAIGEGTQIEARVPVDYQS